MITNVAGADLTATEMFLRELTRESFTVKGERFSSYAKLSAAAGGLMLFNEGSGGEKILIERLMLFTDVADVAAFGYINSASGWTPYVYGYNLHLGQAVSTLGQTYHKAPGVLNGVMGRLHAEVGKSKIIDVGGIIIPNGKGFGIQTIQVTSAYLGFLWREIP